MPASAYYPIFLCVEGCPVLVVGGGDLAERKAGAMLDHGARVVLVAKQATAMLQSWAFEGRIEWRARDFTEVDVEDCRLVFCATADADLNAHVSRAAQQRGIPVNVTINAHAEAARARE